MSKPIIPTGKPEGDTKADRCSP